MCIYKTAVAQFSVNCTSTSESTVVIKHKQLGKRSRTEMKISRYSSLQTVGKQKNRHVISGEALDCLFLSG